jgi:hypothetical protein
MGPSTLPTRQRHRTMRVRVERGLATTTSSDPCTRSSSVGAFAALLVEWKLAERERAKASLTSQSA